MFFIFFTHWRQTDLERRWLKWREGEAVKEHRNSDGYYRNGIYHTYVLNKYFYDFYEENGQN